MSQESSVTPAALEPVAAKIGQGGKVAQGSTFRMSQGYDVIEPRSAPAYPIFCEDWDYVKTKISQISDEATTFHSIGCILLGACVSTLIGIMTGSYTVTQQEAPQTRLVVAWAVVAVTLFCGVSALFFSKKERALTRVKGADVLKVMELIEKRYSHDGRSAEALDDGRSPGALLNLV